MIDKPSAKEDEYFARQEYERKKKLSEDKQKAMAGEEKERLKKLHYMCCPKCGMELIEIDYRHMRIDKCSHCDGIWLDAGELEEIAKNEKGLFSNFLKLF